MSSLKFSFGFGLSNISLSGTPGRRNRKWVSFIITGCLYNEVVFVVYRCPVVNSEVQLHLAWQHKVISA